MGGFSFIFQRLDMDILGSKDVNFMLTLSELSLEDRPPRLVRPRAEEERPIVAVHGFRGLHYYPLSDGDGRLSANRIIIDPSR